MDKNIFIHIGAPKTGSSAIQAFLALNTEYLYLNDFSYPNFKGFSQGFQTDIGNAGDVTDEILNGNIEYIKCLLESTTTTNIILSSELLFPIVKNNVEKFAHFFSGFNFKVICYIRKFDDYTDSSINQAIKNADFGEYVSYFDMIIDEIDWADALISLINCIGVERLIIRNYKRFSATQPEFLITDFLSAIGISETNIANLNCILPESNNNPSLTLDVFHVRRFLNIIEYDKGNNERKYIINQVLANYSVHISKSTTCILSATDRKRSIALHLDKEKRLNYLYNNIYEPIYDYTSTPEDNVINSINSLDIINIMRYIFKNNYIEFEEILKKSFQRFDLIEAQVLVSSMYRTIEDALDIFTENGIFNTRSQYSIITQFAKPEQVITVSNCFNTLNSFYNCEIFCNYSCSYFLITSTNKQPPYFSLCPINVVSGSIYFVEILIDSTYDTTIKCFYLTRSNHKYTPDCYIQTSIKQGLNHIVFTISNPDFSGWIRLDPGIIPGVYKIHNITIKSTAYFSQEVNDFL